MSFNKENNIAFSSATLNNTGAFVHGMNCIWCMSISTTSPNDSPNKKMEKESNAWSRSPQTHCATSVAYIVGSTSSWVIQGQHVLRYESFQNLESQLLRVSFHSLFSIAMWSWWSVSLNDGTWPQGSDSNAKPYCDEPPLGCEPFLGLGGLVVRPLQL